MASGKKPRIFGGVKAKVVSVGEQLFAPPVAHPPKGAPKKFGGVTVPPRQDVLSCPQNCGGTYMEGHWVHDHDCPWHPILWRRFGWRGTDWKCPYQCEAVELPSGWTHAHDCAYWERVGLERTAIRSEGTTGEYDPFPAKFMAPDDELPF